MNDEQAIAWLGRKIGWGFTEGQHAAWSSLGPEAAVELLVNPDGNGVRRRQDRFAGIDVYDSRSSRMARLATESWVEKAITSSRPLETFMEFFWSGYFSVSLRVVRPRHAMVAHMNKLSRHGLGNFRRLLRVVSVDAAMLDFLDNGRNTKKRPNENYARELLELYSVGVGNFSEDDVIGIAKALTGWKVSRQTGEVSFNEGQHDSDRQIVLGSGNVHSVYTAVEACLTPATAARVVHKLAVAILGPDYPAGVADPLVARFGEDWEIRPVVRGLLMLGIEGIATPAVIDPLAWYVSARRLPTSSPHPRSLREFFQLCGQVPMAPPNVGGYPGPRTYLSTSATLARLNLANHLAERSIRPLAGIDVETMTEDLDALAARIGLADGFVSSTRAALQSLPPGPDRLAATLASPEMMVA